MSKFIKSISRFFRKPVVESAKKLETIIPHRNVDKTLTRSVKQTDAEKKSLTSPNDVLSEKETLNEQIVRRPESGITFADSNPGSKQTGTTTPVATPNQTAATGDVAAESKKTPTVKVPKPVVKRVTKEQIQEALKQIYENANKTDSVSEQASKQSSNKPQSSAGKIKSKTPMQRTENSRDGYRDAREKDQFFKDGNPISLKEVSCHFARRDTLSSSTVKSNKSQRITLSHNDSKSAEKSLQALGDPNPKLVSSKADLERMLEAIVRSEPRLTATSTFTKNGEPSRLELLKQPFPERIAHATRLEEASPRVESFQSELSKFSSEANLEGKKTSIISLDPCVTSKYSSKRKISPNGLKVRVISKKVAFDSTQTEVAPSGMDPVQKEQKKKGRPKPVNPSADPSRSISQETTQSNTLKSRAIRIRLPEHVDGSTELETLEPRPMLNPMSYQNLSYSDTSDQKKEESVATPKDGVKRESKATKKLETLRKSKLSDNSNSEQTKTIRKTTAKSKPSNKDPVVKSIKSLTQESPDDRPSKKTSNKKKIITTKK